MGKKAKKTRWRTLTLNGHQSDSEESSSKSGLQTSKNFQHKYSKFPYSSQSTPIRKFQHESSKSTRSNSTTSEHKATFNEDEYTRITTPRQDVLFKKGYLNKPKTYQTQTSTGTSSTANSTSTCTPDHQSADGTEGTDLEYESQFVFPNGFIDQNGIYYINSFEPFPFVVYNAPICYSEYPNSRSKRYSTDSLAESMSPHNEEASQEPSQNGTGDRINNTPVFSQTYLQPAGYYYNGVCSTSNGPYVTEEPRRLKKRRRRKVSRSKSSHEDATSEGTDEYDSSDEVFSQPQGIIEHKPPLSSPRSSLVNHSQSESHETLEVKPELKNEVEEAPEKVASQPSEVELTTEILNGLDTNQSEPPQQPQPTNPEEPVEIPTNVAEDNRLEQPDSTPMEENRNTKSNISDAQNLLLQSLLKNSEKSHGSSNDDTNIILQQTNSDGTEKQENTVNDPENSISNHPTELESEPTDVQANAKYSLKPDAEEFIPRTFRAPEVLPFDPSVQFLNLPHNFIPIPFVNHLGELQRPPFLPPGIPLNFVPSQDPKILPNFVNLVPNGNFVPKTFDNYSEVDEQAESTSTKSEEETEAPPLVENVVAQEEKPKEEIKSEEPAVQPDVEIAQVKKLQTKNEIDIAKIVYKLEEAAKQQRFYENKRQNYSRAPSKYSASRPYPPQRTRYNRQYQENRQYSENRYQRSRPNSLEKQHYERNYRKPELSYQKEQRSKPTCEREGSSDNVKNEAMVETVTEKHKQVNESIQNGRAQENIEKKREPSDQSNFNRVAVGHKRQDRVNSFQRKGLGDHRLVNNVNNRIGESCSMEKDLKLESTSNYSELLKKNVEKVPNNTTSSNSSNNTNKCLRYEKHNSERNDKKPERTLSPSLTPKPQRAQNQWISVSSRKKRKNRSANEEQNLMDTEDVEEELTQNDDLFESFDVSQLVDVVPPSQLNSENVNSEENSKKKQLEAPSCQEEILTAVKEEHLSENLVSPDNDVQIEAVGESAKVTDISTEIDEKEKLRPADVEDTAESLLKEESIAKPEKKKQPTEQKKKFKKGTQKPLVRRVIIKDVDLELNKPAVKEDVEVKLETPSKVVLEAIVKEELVILEAAETGITLTTENFTHINATEDSEPVVEHIVIKETCNEEDSKINQEVVISEEINVCESTKPTLIVDNENLNPSPNSLTQTSESDAVADTPEKKSKKKKKKTPKPQLVKIQSVSSSTTTLSNLDDSYDFLLENSVLENFEQKTNVEISQELDRMIQKGMYSSLEEKIRTLRISATDDGFFRTINYGVLPNQAILEKPNTIKASNFGKMLENTTQLLKTPRVSEEIDNQSLINIDFSKIKLPDLEPQPSTSKTGIFLENPLANELIKSATNNEVNPSLPSVSQEVTSSKTKDNGKLRNKSKKNGQHKATMPAAKPEPEDKLELNGEQMEPKVEKGEDHNGTIEPDSKNLTPSNTFSSHEVESTKPLTRQDSPKHDSLYPITQAVKEWMTKTRENTPDIEILKSPNTIYKEFYGSGTETESETTISSKNGIGDPRPARSVSREKSPLSSETKDKSEGTRVAEITNINNDDEVTIWSVSPQNSIDEDLLDCWENEMANRKSEEPVQKDVKHGNVGKENTIPNKVKGVPVIFQNGNIQEIKGSVHNGQAHLNGHIEEGEDAIEVYESKYGKNEDFLKLKAEIEDQQRTLNFPKHGNLPYRAICCSIM